MVVPSHISAGTSRASNSGPISSQALLVVPDDLPEPRDPSFPKAASRAIRQVINICDGRTLGLFTSYRVLDVVHRLIEGSGHRVLRQGEMPRAELTRVFKEDVHSVLRRQWRDS